MSQRKGLRLYSNEELVEMLERNEEMDLPSLGGVSSEILRRLISGALIKLSRRLCKQGTPL